MLGASKLASFQDGREGPQTFFFSVVVFTEFLHKTFFVSNIILPQRFFNDNSYSYNFA